MPYLNDSKMIYFIFAIIFSAISGIPSSPSLVDISPSLINPFLDILDTMKAAKNAKYNEIISQENKELSLSSS